MLTILGLAMLLPCLLALGHARELHSTGYSVIWVGLEVLGAVVIGAAGVTLAVLGFAVPVSAAEVDFGPAAESLRSVAVEIAIGLLTIAGLWLAAVLKKKWGIDIEAQVRALETMHRGTLHSAVDTWTKAAMAKYGPDLSFEISNPGMQFILEGVAKSAPDAIAALGANTNWIVNKAAGVAGVTLSTPKAS